LNDHRDVDAAPVDGDEKLSAIKAWGKDLARRVWRGAGKLGGAKHPRLKEHLAWLGIDVARLPGGVPPASLRFHESCYEKQVTDAESSRGVRTTVGPAVIATMVSDTGKLEGLRRAFLAEGGAERERGAVQGLGGCKGRVTRLGGSLDDGVLIIAEDLPTGLACLQATGWATWAAFDREGLRTVKIPQDECGVHGRVHTVLFAVSLGVDYLKPDKVHDFTAELMQVDDRLTPATAADIAREHAASRFAWMCAMRVTIDAPWLSVHVEYPGGHQTRAAGLVIDDPAKPGRSIIRDKARHLTWLQVLREIGAERTAEDLRGTLDLAAGREHRAKYVHALATSPAPVDEATGTRAEDADLEGGGGADGPDFTGPGDGGNGVPPWVVNADFEAMPIIEEGAVERARRWLWTQQRVEGHRRYCVARWGAEWWVYRGGAYTKVSDDDLQPVVWHWLNGFRHYRRDKLVRLHPAAKTVTEVMKAIAIDTAVRAEQLPVRLQPVIDDHGRPLWGMASSFEHLAPSGERDRHVLRSRIVFRNGILDLDRLARTGKVELEPHSPEFFTSTCLPFDLAVDELQALIDGRDADEIFTRLCPKFYGWLADASDADPDWEAQLQEMLGDTISNDRSVEKVFLVVGVGRGGKGILEDAIACIIGEANLASTSFASLAGDRFGLYPLLGKAVAIMPDAHLSNFNEGAGAVEILKAISGQGRVQVRDLYQSARSVKLSCRFWIFCNEEPDLRDDSSAFAGRLIVLPVKRGHLGTEDPTIKASIPLEAAGIMLWALMGAIRLARKSPRRIDMCGSSSKLAADFETDSAPLKSFVADCLTIKAGASCLPEDLYEAYVWYSGNTLHRKPLGQPRFFRKVKWFVPGWEYTQPRRPEGDRQRPRRIDGCELRSNVAADISTWRSSNDGPVTFPEGD
jgi:P4 family phage/plasmid primase-like protien